MREIFFYLYTFFAVFLGAVVYHFVQRGAFCSMGCIAAAFLIAITMALIATHLDIC